MRLTIKTLLALALVTSSIGLAAAPASAATGRALDVHNNREAPTTSAKVVGSFRKGATVTFSCYRNGSSIRGPYGTSKYWLRVNNDPRKWVSEAWVYTGTNKPTVRVCPSPTKAPSTPAPAPTSSAWYGSKICTSIGGSNPHGINYRGVAGCSGASTKKVSYGKSGYFCYGNGCPGQAWGPYPTFQCVELTARYMRAIGGVTPAYVDGQKFAAANKKKSTFRLSKWTNRYDSSLKPGVVISMANAKRTGTGHVAIVTAVDTKGKRIQVLEQNYNAAAPGRAALARKAWSISYASGKLSYGRNYFTQFQWLSLR